MEIEKERDPSGRVLGEECCKTKRTFIVHTSTLYETSTEVWLLAYQHLNTNYFQG
jgi:hypothetical protein